MTREEASFYLANMDRKYMEEGMSEALDMAIKALEQTKWIPVSERVPENDGSYLVTVKQGYVTLGIWLGIAENWTEVIAWMPLPEPYKAESEEV